MSKVLKDPVYGYIQIEGEILSDIIDTPEFQRLRHIEQTSYTPLYSSALHNRFVHSIGVYHLGSLVSSVLFEYVKGNEELSLLGEEKIQHICKDYELACLLHDVGHSPFSHSGEKFYYSCNGAKNEPIFSSLKQYINKKAFKTDFSSCIVNKEIPKQHEIMSAIIGVSKFKHFIHDVEFFARCITGVKYESDSNALIQIKNIFIKLLNSSCIDVDKIDYLIRDAYVTGFETISIDYKRLLSNVEIKKYNGKLELVFNKKALSILENVIYAHDAERKWIQNHPIVLYEAFLVQYAIKSVVDFYKRKNIDLFSEKALSAEGITSPCKIRLLCDDDIIYVMKNELSLPLVNEYFDRKLRRHPIWKSEAEYKVIFDNKKGKDWTKQFASILSKLNNFLEKESPSPILNQDSLSFCEESLDSVKNALDIDEYDKCQFKKKYEDLKQIIMKFQHLSKAMHIDFDFVIIEANRFKTGFSKSELQRMLISFPGFEQPRELKSVTNLLDSLPPDEKNFYYLFYKRKPNSSMTIADFSEKIDKEFNSLIQKL